MGGGQRATHTPLFAPAGASGFEAHSPREGHRGTDQAPATGAGTSCHRPWWDGLGGSGDRVPASGGLGEVALVPRTGHQSPETEQYSILAAKGGGRCSAPALPGMREMVRGPAWSARAHEGTWRQTESANAVRATQGVSLPHLQVSQDVLTRSGALHLECPASARLKGFCSFSRQSPGRTTSRAAAKTGSPGSPDLRPCRLCLGSWDPRGCGTRHHGYHWGHRARCPRRRPCTQRVSTPCWGRIIQKTKPHPTWEKRCPGLGLLGQRAQPSTAVQVLGNTEGAWESPQEAAPLGKDRQRQRTAHASHEAT